jgi:hypothetical protein
MVIKVKADELGPSPEGLAVNEAARLYRPPADGHPPNTTYATLLGSAAVLLNLPSQGCSRLLLDTGQMGFYR